MTTKTISAPRKTLASQLDRLDDLLDGLADAIPDTVADAVRQAVCAGVQNAIGDLLANPEVMGKVAAQESTHRRSGPASSSSWLHRAWQKCCQVVQQAWEQVTGTVQVVVDRVRRVARPAVAMTTKAISVVSSRTVALTYRWALPVLLVVAVVSSAEIMGAYRNPLKAVVFSITVMPLLLLAGLWLEPGFLLVLLERLAT